MSKALELANHFERAGAAIERLDRIVEIVSSKADRYLATAAELRRLASIEQELERIKALEPVGRVVWLADVEGTMKEVRWDDPCGPAIGTQLFDLTPEEPTT